MTVDFDRYRSLLSRCAFDASFYTGSIQDLSPAQRAMSFVGSPSFSKINGWPCLKQNANGGGCQSGAVAGVVDVTGTWTLEVLIQTAVASPHVLQWTTAGLAGGFSSFINANRFLLYVFDAVGGTRSLQTPVGSCPAGGTLHVVMTSIAGATAGTSWVNGVPQTVSLAGAVVVVNPVATPIRWGGGILSVGLQCGMLGRAWPFAFGNADATCLAEAAKLMVGGW